MASQNYSQNHTVGDLGLTCDLCQSDEIIETEQVKKAGSRGICSRKN
ncbi:MAG: hypothetical protein GF311_11990 [Candidatus Lokiarchaeota archaeon]|nr:hypothetical protein [Candidatus Lokiarchaeota archaeon]